MSHVWLHLSEWASLAGRDGRTPTPRHHRHAIPLTHRQWYLAGGGIVSNSWLVSVGFLVAKRSFHEASWLSVSTVVNDFYLCGVLAHAAEQWGILGHGKRPAPEPPGNEPHSSFGARAVHRRHLWAKAQRMSAQSRFLLFPGTASPEPRAPWARVQPPKW